MPTLSETQLKDRIRQGLGQAWEGLVDMIDEIHKSHQLTDPRADIRRSIELTVDVFLETVDLPWGVPSALLKAPLVAALSEAVAQKNAA